MESLRGFPHTRDLEVDYSIKCFVVNKSICKKTMLPRAISLTLLLSGFCLSTASAQDFMLAVSPNDGALEPAPGSQPLNLGSFNIVINAGNGLSSNTAALAAFQRAALQWKAFISDPITVNINANLAALGTGIIGSTSSVILQAGYNTLRNQLVADAADEPDDAIVSFLPTAAQFTATVQSGKSLTGNLVATKANLKAMGFTGLDGSFGTNDASITFSSNFSFDYDNSDGVGAGLMDFESVAAHEIGHALGFFSAVDDADAGATSLQPSMLDLFRFQDNSANDPSNSSQFTTFARNLVPGATAIFDDTTHEWLMSTGVNGGDGRQASHWKDNLGLGMMDPTLSYGEISSITATDLRAFDLIGYEIIPEPSCIAAITLGGLILGARRKRRNA